MRRVWKKLEVRAARAHEGRALVDTGMPVVLIPWTWARLVGLSQRKAKTVTYDIAGRRLAGTMRLATLRLEGGCRARTLVFVPDDAVWHPKHGEDALVGSTFLQKTKATIRYRGKHPVTCRRERNPAAKDLVSFGEYDS